MRRSPVHQPPPPTVIADLLRCGLSPTTANAMETWKAHEVLELLRATMLSDGEVEPVGPSRATI